MQRVRSSAVAQGSEYFSIYLRGVEERSEGEAGHEDKKRLEYIKG